VFGAEDFGGWIGDVKLIRFCCGNIAGVGDVEANRNRVPGSCHGISYTIWWQSTAGFVWGCEVAPDYSGAFALVLAKRAEIRVCVLPGLLDQTFGAVCPRRIT
jgi:hypothetical protein